MVKTFIASEIPIDREITGQLGSVGVQLRSVSRQSCTVEHERQVRVSSDLKLHFRWEGVPYAISVRVLRSRIGMLEAGGTGYHTTVEFVAIPDDVTVLIDRFVEAQRKRSDDRPRSDGEGIRA